MGAYRPLSLSLGFAGPPGCDYPGVASPRAGALSLSLDAQAHGF